MVYVVILMKKEDYYFNLPEELIAQYPMESRTDSRLLVFDGNSDSKCDSLFKNVIEYINPGDLVVLNDSRVIPARLFGRKETGGKVELLVERVIDSNHCLCHIKASKAPKVGSSLILDDDYRLIVMDREDDLFRCRLFGDDDLYDVLEAVGHIPLPPYIQRSDEDKDFTRYQTVYAKHNGSVAAPTAGLHFDKSLLKAIEAKGASIDYVTLHVGAGTFQPVRTDDINDHKMHSERITVSQSLCDKIATTKQQGSKVIAVGTTVVRSLESAALSGKLSAYDGETEIFIYPGFRFKVCDAIVTNFHLPESTLLMLISAFIGREEVMNLYEHAINKQYRFFSYGDACLLLSGESNE